MPMYYDSIVWRAMVGLRGIPRTDDKSEELKIEGNSRDACLAIATYRCNMCGHQQIELFSIIDQSELFTGHPYVGLA